MINHYSNSNSGTVHGSVTQVSGNGNTVPAGPAPSQAEAGTATGQGQEPRHALYAFADIVGYSRFAAWLQDLSQRNLVGILERGIAAAGTRPGSVVAQDQGDARLLTFPPDTDTGRMLAVLPRFLHEEFEARNQVMTPDAQMRVRLAFVMGMGAPGATGVVGDAPIAVARLANSAVFREAMRAAPLAHCGLLIDDYLYVQVVRPGFRADLNQADYAPVDIREPGKGFEARAWMRLFGYPGSPP